MNDEAADLVINFFNQVIHGDFQVDVGNDFGSREPPDAEAGVDWALTPKASFPSCG